MYVNNNLELETSIQDQNIKHVRIQTTNMKSINFEEVSTSFDPNPSKCEGNNAEYNCKQWILYNLKLESGAVCITKVFKEQGKLMKILISTENKEVFTISYISVILLISLIAEIKFKIFKKYDLYYW